MTNGSNIDILWIPNYTTIPEQMLSSSQTSTYLTTHQHRTGFSGSPKWGWEKMFKRAWTSHLWLPPPPASPPIPRHGGSQNIQNIENGFRWLLDGSQSDPNKLSKTFKKTSDVFSKMTFNYPRSSPKSPRRLPTTTITSLKNGQQKSSWLTHVTQKVDRMYQISQTISMQSLKNPPCVLFAVASDGFVPPKKRSSC